MSCVEEKVIYPYAVVCVARECTVH